MQKKKNSENLLRLSLSLSLCQNTTVTMAMFEMFPGQEFLEIPSWNKLIRFKTEV